MIYSESHRIVVRTMQKSDIEAFPKGFAAKCWQKPAEQYERYYNEQKNKFKHIIVAELDDKLAGYVTLKPKAMEGPYKDFDFPEIVDFNVFIKYQQMGVGNRILDVAENIASQTSNFVTLAVGMHSGYGSAQRIYVKRGYLPDGSGVWYKGKILEEYAPCSNDDDLILYFSKCVGTTEHK